MGRRAAAGCGGREIVIDAADGHDRERAGTRARPRGTAPAGTRGGRPRRASRSSLKNSLMPSASVCRMPERPGLVRADAVLHVGDDLALEPDHEHDGDHQHGEGDDGLDDDDERTRAKSTPPRRAGRRRREVRSRRLHPDVGDRRAPASMRSAAPRAASEAVEGQAGRCRGARRDRRRRRARWMSAAEDDPHPPARRYAETIEVVGVGTQHGRGRRERRQRRRVLHERAVVVERRCTPPAAASRRRAARPRRRRRPAAS